MADLIISIQYMYDVILEVRGPIPRHVLDVDRMLPSLKFQGPSSRDSKLHLSQSNTLTGKPIDLRATHAQYPVW